jgi:hypothetical protein
MIDCRLAQARLERAFVTQRWSALTEVHAHIRSCPRCRRAYEGLFAAERLLATPEEHRTAPAAASARLSPSEQALLLSRALPLPERPAPRLRRDLIAALAGAVMVVAAALWVRAPLAPSPRPEPALASRGQDALDAALAPLGLRALCLERTGRGESDVTARSMGTTPLPGTRPCGQQSALGFTVRNETGAAWSLQVVLAAADGTVLRAFPTGDATGEIAPAEDESPLPGSTPLASVSPGRLEIFALFSRPAAARDLLAAVRAGRTAEIGRGGGHVLRFAVEVAR